MRLIRDRGRGGRRRGGGEEQVNISSAHFHPQRPKRPSATAGTTM